MLAAHFFPDNLWSMVAAFLLVGGLIIVASLWAAARFGGTAMWAATGMFIGGMGAAAWQLVLLPIGIVVGAVAGSLFGIAYAKLGR